MAFRWFKFNAVGILGFLLQLSVLWTLGRWAGVDYLLATALAVEAAVLHNFVWHELWTWKDILVPGFTGVWNRLLRFHVSNGFTSIVGNLLLMRLFAGEMQMPLIQANILSIAICSAANFLLSHFFVFRRKGSGPVQAGSN